MNDGGQKFAADSREGIVRRVFAEAFARGDFDTVALRIQGFYLHVTLGRGGGEVTAKMDFFCDPKLWAENVRDCAAYILQEYLEVAR